MTVFFSGLFSPFAVPVLFAAALMLLLGVFVLGHERFSPESISFFLMALVVSIWLGGMSGIYFSQNEAGAVFWSKIAYVGVPLIPAAIYHFSLSVLQLQKKKKTLAFCWLFSFALALAAIYGDRFITGVYRYSWGWYPSFGPLAPAFLLYFTVVMIVTLFYYLRQHGRTEKRTVYRRRVRSFLAAFCIGYLAAADLLPSLGISVYPFGFIPVFIFMSLAAWAVRRYRLVDITPAFAADQVIGTMSEALFVVDSGGVIRVANRPALVLLDAADGPPITGRPLAAICPDLELNSLLAGHGAESSIERLCDIGGRKKILEVSSAPLVDEDGKMVGSVCVARDLTEKRSTESHLRNLRIAMEHAVEGIARVRSPGVFAETNKAFASMLGFEPEELAGQEWTSCLQSEEMKKAGDAHRIMMTTTGRAETELQGRRKDGSLFYMRMVMVCTPDQESDPGSFYLFVRDITEQKSREAVQFKSEMISMVAHELRSPLHSVREGVSVLLEGLAGEITGDQKEILGSTKLSLDRLSRLVNSVLDFHRLEAGVAKLEFRPNDLNDLVREAVKSSRPYVESRGLYLREDLAPGIPSVECDRDRIIQVLVNLIHNAAKFTDQGGIEVSSSFENGEVLLSVRDTGIGIRKADLDRLFRKFVQVHSGYRPGEQGTGLGLIISKMIVDQHQGRITVQSDFGKGSTFSFSLPAAARRQKNIESLQKV